MSRNTEYPPEYPEELGHTKVTYIGDHAATLTLRRCKLVVDQAGKLSQRVFDKDLITIGTSADNDLVLDDETVSRNHCRIFLEGDRYMIADQGSTNGTMLNGVRIREAFLRPHQVVTLGTTEIHFEPVDEKVRIVPSDKQRLGDIIGGNARMREIYSILEKVAPTDTTIIIEGETGTGKEVVARTIHQLSRRREGPFIVFDCGAVPENLIESELFGHEKGSFTGAVTSRLGVFEMGHNGSVFLDELGELNIDLQPKLLRVLEQREVKRVGSNRTTKVNVRIIAATNRDLEHEVRQGNFRQDLFYRLSVVRVRLPALRERKEDIPLLVKHFLRIGHFNYDRDGNSVVKTISQEAIDALMEYPWPGNVRELSNVVERAVSFAEGGNIDVKDLPEHIVNRGGPEETTASHALQDMMEAGTAPIPSPLDGGAFKDAKEKWLASFERDYIANLLTKHGGNISHAAREAQIDRKYFRKLMKKYELGANDEPEVEE